MKMLGGALLLCWTAAFADDCLVVNNQGDSNEPFVLKGVVAPCVIVAADARYVVIDQPVIGPNDGQGVEAWNPGNGITVYGDDITIRGGKITGQPGNGVHAVCRMSTADGGPCTEYPHRLRIEDNRIEKVGRNGVKFDICDDCAIVRNRITQTLSSGIQVNEVRSHWIGRYYEPGSQPPLDIIFNEIDHAGYDEPGHQAHGIYTGEPGRIESNRIHDVWGYGLHIWPDVSERVSAENPLDMRFNRVYREHRGGTVLGGGRTGLVYWHNGEYWNGDSEMLP